MPCRPSDSSAACPGNPASSTTGTSTSGCRNGSAGSPHPAGPLAVDFAELTALEEAERWDRIGQLLSDAARGVERAGADFLVLCTTTFHKVADDVAARRRHPAAPPGRRRRGSSPGSAGDQGRPDRDHGRDAGLLLRRPDGDPWRLGRRTGHRAPRLPQHRDLRRAGPRPRRGQDPPPGRRDRRRAVGRRRPRACWSAAPGGAADLAVRHRPAGVPLHHPARQGGAGPGPGRAVRPPGCPGGTVAASAGRTAPTSAAGAGWSRPTC